MGNFYKAEFHFKLKKDTPKNIMDMIYFLNDDYWEEYVGADCDEEIPRFKSILKSFNISYETSGNEFCPSIYAYDGDVTVKSYTKNLSDSAALLLVDICRPYMVNEKYEDNYLGTICDEDGFYYKQIFIDESIYKKALEERGAICNSSCKYFHEHVLCESFPKCKRAYDIGVKDGNGKV